MDRSTHPIRHLDTESPATGPEVKAWPRTGRLLEFPVGRKAVRPGRGPISGRRSPGVPVKGGAVTATPRARFLRAIEMEGRGFVDGAVASLRSLRREADFESDPCLAINVHYFLASFLMLQDEMEEARILAEEGIILAWENGAREELELLENLSRQLGS